MMSSILFPQWFDRHQMHPGIGVFKDHVGGGASRGLGAGKYQMVAHMHVGVQYDGEQLLLLGLLQ